MISAAYYSLKGYVLILHECLKRNVDVRGKVYVSATAIKFIKIQLCFYLHFPKTWMKIISYFLLLRRLFFPSDYWKCVIFQKTVLRKSAGFRRTMTNEKGDIIFQHIINFSKCCVQNLFLTSIFHANNLFSLLDIYGGIEFCFLPDILFHWN